MSTKHHSISSSGATSSAGNTTKKYSHLSFEERVIIADRLKSGCSIKKIAHELERSPSTISREIKNHLRIETRKSVPCAHAASCTARELCSGCTSKNRYHCYNCPKCVTRCANYTPMHCPKLSESPYVCNACTKKGFCRFQKQFYDATFAHMEYKEYLSETRCGFDMSQEELTHLDMLITPLIKQGLSPYHILQSLDGEINISESTLRRIINASAITVRNIDLRIQVKRKQRHHKANRNTLKMLAKQKIGHGWEDFLRFKNQNPDLCIVEMDCVEGLQTEKPVLLTLHFTQYHLQIALILEEHTSEQVIRGLDKIETALGSELFKKMFPVLLTDNGHEFADRKGLEKSINGDQRTTVYYCEPNRSDEKGHCEKNHTLIRYVIPKGTSLEPFSQQDISLMMNHINSYLRQSLGGNSPYDAARFWNVPEDFFVLLGLEKIPSLEVNLTPSLLKKK